MTIDERYLDFRRGGKYHNGKSPGYTSKDIDRGIKSAIANERSKLKPQYKNAGLLVDVMEGFPNENDTTIQVQVKSIVKGLSTPEELYK